MTTQPAIDHRGDSAPATVVDGHQAPPNGEHNPARPDDCARLCGAPGCARWGCLS